MTNKEIKAMGQQELKDRIVKEREVLRSLKIAHKLTDVENPLQIKYNRRFVARLLTELRAKEIATDLNT